MNPFGTHHCQRCPTPTVNHHRDPRFGMPRARRASQTFRRDHLWNQRMKRLQKPHEKMWRTHRCLTEEAHRHLPVPRHPRHHPTRVRRRQQGQPDQDHGTHQLESRPRPPLPKRLRSVNVDDNGMLAGPAEVTEVCEEPQPDWEALASNENVGSTWFMRRQCAQMIHLGHLREHRVYEELDLPQGVKPLSMRCVDKDGKSNNTKDNTGRLQLAQNRETWKEHEQELGKTTATAAAT